MIPFCHDGDAGSNPVRGATLLPESTMAMDASLSSWRPGVRFPSGALGRLDGSRLSAVRSIPVAQIQPCPPDLTVVADRNGTRLEREFGSHEPMQVRFLPTASGASGGAPSPMSGTNRHGPGRVVVTLHRGIPPLRGERKRSFARIERHPTPPRVRIPGPLPRSPPPPFRTGVTGAVRRRLRRRRTDRCGSSTRPSFPRLERVSGRAPSP